MALTCKNGKLIQWVKDVQEMVTPDKVVWCDGSKAEYDAMIKIMVDAGAATPLKKRPNSYLFRSHPSDVARVEDLTLVPLGFSGKRNGAVLGIPLCSSSVSSLVSESFDDTSLLSAA